MMKILSLSFLGILCATPFHAEEAKQCLTIKRDELRLECYDQVLGYETESDNSVEVKSAWIFNSKKDEFTGKNTSYVFLPSDKADQTYGDAPSSMIVRSNGNGGVDIYVNTHGYIGARGNSIPVKYKFGNSEIETERWNESAKGTAAFLPDGYKDFKAGLMTGKSFLFEVTDYRGAKESARFPETKLDADFRFVFGGCKAN